MARYTSKLPGFGKQYSSVGSYVPQKDMANPLDEMMAPTGNQTVPGAYDDGLQNVFGNTSGRINVEKADRVRFDSVRFLTHGRNPSDDDQA